MALMLLVMCSITASPLILHSQTNKLSEISRLKAENFKLKTAVLACRVEEASYSNSVEQAKLKVESVDLEKEFREELKVNEKDLFDWNTLSFISVPNPK
jgi:hypothetical protein